MYNTQYTNVEKTGHFSDKEYGIYRVRQDDPMCEILNNVRRFTLTLVEQL